MVMIMMPVKGRQKNLLWCMGSYGNTSMPKSLTSNRQNLEKKKKKKKKRKHENGVLAVSLSIGEL